MLVFILTPGRFRNIAGVASLPIDVLQRYIYD
jgi:hypothetical protein